MFYEDPGATGPGLWFLAYLVGAFVITGLLFSDRRQWLVACSVLVIPGFVVEGFGVLSAMSQTVPCGACVMSH
ncbi:hypothetical protein AA23498_3597 [Acetobacter nitrogenifigens DSM 23921 = NBRC 105050]|uniref:Uncharacterized protein n=1 Tax=Acetobacter nitrogenifigens DSM 23921 = NBRC 105050 TaxID=1120919 RepID=A0A511XFD2_9PROT|nr:hypothetical protein [Acetobacter nitrogenifigens]GBR00018.1 hypothetical protein AA23498_3597 [Acetobacter nitrogenifigens DSM 23921 = NBRC 105050]GEN61672.1 hypothetical protein ANI02nite_35560 [Acetobacter nitrogenifigens DSM 23921 = NBRC 105050]